jgi:acetone carboxylase gamma subunit
VAKKETFLDIMQSDNRNEDVLEFLKTHNLLKGEKGFTFHQMLWMLKDKAFFIQVLAVLKERLIYNDQVWSYAVFHRLVEDEATLREYIMNNKPYNL